MGCTETKKLIFLKQVSVRAKNAPVAHALYKNRC